MPMSAPLDPFSAAGAAAPHESYTQMRALGPVHQTVLPNGMPVWLVTGYAEARRVLADARLSRAAARGAFDAAAPPEVRAALTHHVLASDPPDHTRLRRLVSAVFTARRVESLRPRVQQITDELLEAIAGESEVDLMSEFAYPLPIRVICELLGIPVADQINFRRWSDAFVSRSFNTGFPLAEVTEFIGYLRDMVRRKRAVPDGGLVSALITARDQEDRLDDDELISTIFLLIVAGHETTVNLIGNTVYLLLTHPRLAARLRAEPQAVPAAIEEFLRYESPVPLTGFRIATEAIEIGGNTIPAGAMVGISVQSANRDDTAFPGAAGLDVGRADSPHLAFGHGLHYCLGAPLARLEGHIAIGTLLRRYPTMRLGTGEVAWRPGMYMRGLVDLPVVLR
jgi:cytochrome P450